MKSIDHNRSMYARIDSVIIGNQRAEQIVIGMTVLIFLIGVVMIVIGTINDQPIIYGSSIFIEGFLYWPINKILLIRKENIILAVTPALIETLPAKQAAAEMIKLLARVKV